MIKRLEEIREVPSLALEATIPNSRVMGGGTSVEAFFRTNSQFDLVRTVGKKEMPLGTIETKKLLIICRCYEANLDESVLSTKTLLCSSKNRAG